MTMNSNICSYKRNAKEKHYESECNMYTHPILHVVKVILLTCKHGKCLLEIFPAMSAILQPVNVYMRLVCSV